MFYKDIIIIFESEKVIFNKIMDKIDLGFVKTTTRVIDGVKINVRLFNKKQRQLIINEVEKRPPEMRIEDMLNLYGVSPAVYYTWLKNVKKKEKVEKSQIPNPLTESFSKLQFFSSREQMMEFYKKKSPELKEFIDRKLKEWMQEDMISQFALKITPQNIEEVAKAAGITVGELELFLKRENMNLPFIAVDGIRRYLKI